MQSAAAPEISRLEKLIREASALFARRDEAGSVHVKGRSDYVTDVDFHVQKKISETLSVWYPEIQFMGEEQDNSSIRFEDAVWILDPVDGTTNLIHDMRASVISLALAVNREIVLGIVYWPYMDEMFTAGKGKGTFLNGKPVHVSGADRLSDSLISVGTSPYRPELADRTFAAAKELFLTAQDIRRSGSAALELAYVACGRLEGTFELSLSPWDFSAGLLLIEEAGGRVTDAEGAALDFTKKGSIAGSNGRIHDALIRILDQSGKQE